MSIFLCLSLPCINIYIQAPVLLLTMANVALYTYAKPYQKLYITLVEVIMLVDVLLLLMFTSTKVIVYNLLQSLLNWQLYI